MASASPPSNESIICDTLGAVPDVRFASQDGALHLSRWRSMVGTYRLPAMPSPIYVAHIGGKREVKTWQQDGWSERGSRPSDSTLMPGCMESSWRVDGELDVVTISLYDPMPTLVTPGMRFAFADPLGNALVRQSLAALYQQQTPERDSYIEILLTALRAHLLHGATVTDTGGIPATMQAADRVHRVLARINANPQHEFALEDLAQEAGLNPTYFCRVFRKATGNTPLAYVLKKRIDRAQHMLRQSDLSIGEICDTTGFKSQSHFSRLFRQQTGQSPSEFRALKRKD